MIRCHVAAIKSQSAIAPLTLAVAMMITNVVSGACVPDLAGDTARLFSPELKAFLLVLDKAPWLGGVLCDIATMNSRAMIIPRSLAVAFLVGDVWGCRRELSSAIIPTC
jgi:hypothetical protein